MQRRKTIVQSHQKDTKISTFVAAVVKFLVDTYAQGRKADRIRKLRAQEHSTCNWRAKHMDALSATLDNELALKKIQQH